MLIHRDKQLDCVCFFFKFSTLAAVGQRGTSTSILRLNMEQSMNIAGERDERQEKDPILFYSTKKC